MPMKTDQKTKPKPKEKSAPKQKPLPDPVADAKIPDPTQPKQYKYKLKENGKFATGRPESDLDYELIGRLATIQCTISEIAAILGVSVDTLEKNEKFYGVYYEKKESGKMSLRRRQWDKALSGDSTSLIWLGKQYLGQSDKAEQTIKGETIIKVTIDDEE